MGVARRRGSGRERGTQPVARPATGSNGRVAAMAMRCCGRGGGGMFWDDGEEEEELLAAWANLGVGGRRSNAMRLECWSGGG